MHQYFLLQNASICTISTHFASIFLVAKCVDIANAFCYKKKSKCYNCNIGAKCVVTELYTTWEILTQNFDATSTKVTEENTDEQTKI